MKNKIISKALQNWNKTIKGYKDAKLMRLNDHLFKDMFKLYVGEIADEYEKQLKAKDNEIKDIFKDIEDKMQIRAIGLKTLNYYDYIKIKKRHLTKK